MSQKKILIVGGAGYIGSHVNQLLGKRGYETVIFDNLSRGHRSAITCGEFVKGDLGNPKDLNHLFKSFPFDAVFHFAALTDVGESVLNPALYYEKNVTDTLNLLNAMRSFGVLKIIFSSSAAIFGMPQSDKLDEHHPCSPINPYGQSKLMVETILKDFDRAYGLKSCCLRYFNAAGGDPKGIIKWHDRKENNLIPLLLSSVANPSKKVTLFGTDYNTKDGTCIRDYIHVCDLADAHIAAMEEMFASGNSTEYNLGNARGYTVREVIDAVIKVTGHPLSIVEGERRPGDPAILIADPTKAEKTLKWKAQYCDIETMVSHAWKARLHPLVSESF